MKNRLLEKEENRAIAAQVQLQREQLPPEQSKALGEAARSRVPRESHSTFSLPSERENPVALLEAQAKDPANPYVQNNLDLLADSLREGAAVK